MNMQMEPPFKKMFRKLRSPGRDFSEFSTEIKLLEVVVEKRHGTLHKGPLT